MKGLAAVLALLVVAVGVAVVVAAGGDGDAYRVRAIFDNAGFVIPGEDVKVAGVKVGRVESLDVTPQFKAAVVLRIDDPGYQDFRRDASCIVRPQSLIGEKFVECEPTQARAEGTRAPGPLRRIARGPGTGQYLLPVERTEQAVDLDLVNNIMRLPYRQRLSLILNELGAAVAGRGEDVRAVVRRAAPALTEIDRVLAILGRQNRALADLARNGDAILAPLARERRHVSGALASSAAVARATAERRDDLARDLRLAPQALRQLRPTMTRLAALSDEMTPVLADLHGAAPDVNRTIVELGPFSQAAIPAVESLGAAARTGTPAITASRPVIRDLRNLGRAARPVALTVRQLLESFRRTGGIERLMDYLYNQVAAINGFDSFGHYLRAALIVNTCSTYTVRPVPGCSANFSRASASAAAGGPHDEALARTATALRSALAAPTRTPEATVATPTAAPRPSATPVPAPQPTPAASASDPLLDLLFGSDGP